MKKIVFFVLSLLLAANNVMADDTVTGAFVGPSTDNQWTLDVNLTNENEYVGFKMDITLPEGVTITKATPVSSRLVTGENVTINETSVETPFVLTYEPVASKDNTYRVSAYNLGNNAIQGTTGYPIVKLLLQADREMTYSEMIASFSDVDFVKAYALSDNTLATTNASIGLLDQYLKITATETGTLKLSNVGWTQASFQYATATTGWQDYTCGSEISLAKGNSTWFRANGTNGKNSTLGASDRSICFKCTTGIAASQNVMSLLDASCEQTEVPAYGLRDLFLSCTKLTTAPELPATTLGKNCYSRMFANCQALTTAPELPATTLAESCYYLMFSGCTTLTSIPDLSHAVLSEGANNACYQMFYNCKNLIVNTLGLGTEWKITTEGSGLSGTDNNFAGMFGSTAGDFTGAPEKDVTYYVLDKPYTRTMANQWGTLVLPFDIDYDADNTDYNLYYLSAANNKSLTFTEYKSQTIAAGTPMAVKKLSGDGIEISPASTPNFNTEIQSPDAVGGLTAKGTYTQTTIGGTEGNGVYFIASNQFWRADATTTVKPFRAWFEGTPASGNAKSFTIVEVDEADGIDLIPALSQGEGVRKYLEGGKVVIVRNGKKFNINGQVLK